MINYFPLALVRSFKIVSFILFVYSSTFSSVNSPTFLTDKIFRFFASPCKRKKFWRKWSHNWIYKILQYFHVIRYQKILYFNWIFMPKIKLTHGPSVKDLSSLFKAWHSRRSLRSFLSRCIFIEVRALFSMAFSSSSCPPPRPPGIASDKEMPSNARPNTRRSFWSCMITANGNKVRMRFYSKPLFMILSFRPFKRALKQWANLAFWIWM